MATYIRILRLAFFTSSPSCKFHLRSLPSNLYNTFQLTTISYLKVSLHLRLLTRISGFRFGFGVPTTYIKRGFGSIPRLQKIIPPTFVTHHGSPRGLAGFLAPFAPLHFTSIRKYFYRALYNTGWRSRTLPSPYLFFPQLEEKEADPQRLASFFESSACTFYPFILDIKHVLSLRIETAIPSPSSQHFFLLPLRHLYLYIHFGICVDRFGVWWSYRAPWLAGLVGAWVVFVLVLLGVGNV